MAHPVAELIRDRSVRSVWAGLSGSYTGDELYRIGLVWIAIELAGASAAWVPAAQNATVMVISLTVAGFADRFSPKTIMVGSSICRAVIVLVPVVLFFTIGLTLASLIAAAVALAVFRAIFDPVLFSSVPKLADAPERIQSLTGLFDTMARLARLVGPLLASLLSLVLPTIHILSVNALAYLGAAYAFSRVDDRLKQPPVPFRPIGAAQTRIIDRLLRGFRIVQRTPDIRFVLFSNAAVLIGWVLGISLGVPMLVAQHLPAEGTFSGLVAVGMVLGTYGLGDLVASVVVTSLKARIRPRRMFIGYLASGLGIAAISSGVLSSEPLLAIGLMMGAAFFSALGGPFFFVPMMTLLQTRLAGPDLTSVLRFRLALISAALMTGAAVGTWTFAANGAAVTILVVGLGNAAVGLYGMLRCPEGPA